MSKLIVASSFVGAVTLFGCTNAGDANSNESSGTGSMADDGGSSTTETTQESTGGPLNCIPGAEGCECLSGECAGSLQCVENTCLPGPAFDPRDNETELLAGLVAPIRVGVEADEFSWSQISGPETTIIGDGFDISVPVPADAVPGDVITLRITATRNTIEATFDYPITIVEPVFEDLLATITDPAELGTSTAINVQGAQLWVTSNEGFVSLFDLGGDSGAVFSQRIDVAALGTVTGRMYAADIDDDVDALFVSDPTSQAVRAVRLDTGAISVLFDTLDDDSGLGPVGTLLRDGNDIFASTRTGGTVVHYSRNDDITTVFTAAVGTNPDALAMGPDDSLYVGSTGKVWRVPRNVDGTAADPEPYLEFGDELDPLLQVTGLAFDEAGNLWVGVAGTKTLYLTNFVTDGATTIAREFPDVGATYSNFTDIRYGGRAIYWANGQDRSVGRLETGVRAL